MGLGLGAAPLFQTQVLASQKASGTAFNTFSTAQSVINPTELCPLPPNYLQVGTKLRVRSWGALSNSFSTGQTVTFQIMIGPPGALIIAWTSGALHLTDTTTASSPFLLDVTIRVDAAGSGTSALIMGGGWVTALNLALASATANPTVTNTILAAPATAPADGTGFDSTVTDILDFWVGFNTSLSTIGIQIYDYTVEQLA